MSEDAASHENDSTSPESPRTNTEEVIDSSEITANVSKCENTATYENKNRSPVDTTKKTEKVVDSSKIFKNEMCVEKYCSVSYSNMPDSTQSTAQDNQTSLAQKSGSLQTRMFVPIAPKTPHTNREYVPVIPTKKKNRGNQTIDGTIESSDSGTEEKDCIRCDICRKTFFSHWNLNRHKRNKCNPPLKGDCFKCDICFRTFKAKSNFLRHQKQVKCKAQDDMKKRFQCRRCPKQFQSYTGRRRHELTHGYFPEYRKSFKCSECLEDFNTSKEILNHYQFHPQVQLYTEGTTFQNEQDFKSWKLEMEESTSSSYIIYQSYNTAKGRLTTYACHRSGGYASRATKRRQKEDSVKSGYYCPSCINATYLNDGRVEVEFTHPHVGHECELRKLRLNENAKAELAGLMQSGVPMSDILEKITTEADPTKRLYLTKWQDLRNLSVSFGVKTVKRLRTLCRGEKKKKMGRKKKKKKPAEKKKVPIFLTEEEAVWYEDSLDVGEIVFSNDGLVMDESLDSFRTENQTQKEVQKAIKEDDLDVSLEELKEQAKAAVSSLIPEIDSFTGEEQCRALLKFIKKTKENRLLPKNKKKRKTVFK